MHPFTREQSHDIKGTVALELYFKTNKDKFIQTCLRFYVIELEGDEEEIFGSNFLLNNKQIVSLNTDCLSWEIGDEVHRKRVFGEKATSLLQDIYLPAVNKDRIVATQCSSDGDCATFKREIVQNFSFHFKWDLSNETSPGMMYSSGSTKS